MTKPCGCNPYVFSELTFLLMLGARMCSNKKLTEEKHCAGVFVRAI